MNFGKISNITDSFVDVTSESKVLTQSIYIPFKGTDFHQE